MSSVSSLIDRTIANYWISVARKGGAGTSAALEKAAALLKDHSPTPELKQGTAPPAEIGSIKLLRQ